MEKMKAVVFRGVGDLRVEEVAKPRPGPGEAVLTSCSAARAMVC
jgi:hypothetical protein